MAKTSAGTVVKPAAKDRDRGSARGRVVAWTATAGLALGAAFAFSRWSSLQARAEHPPIGEFIETDGVSLHYVEKGSGSPIVLLHGSGSTLQDFTVSGLFDVLAEKHRVIAFDRPGYGYSTRPRGRSFSPEDQAALFSKACRELGIERPVVVGHSWGTLPSMAWALDDPDGVSGLALLSGYYFGTPRLDAILTGVAALPVIGDAYTQTVLPIQARLTGPLGLAMVFAPDAVPERFKKDMPLGLMLRPSQLRATAADSGQMPIAAARLSARYGELTLPLTIVWGSGDKLVGQKSQSARLAAEIAHARSLELTDAGHMLHYSHLSAVAAEIEALAMTAQGSA